MDRLGRDTDTGIGVEIRHRRQFFWCRERRTPTPTPRFWVLENPAKPRLTPTQTPVFLVSRTSDTDTKILGVRESDTDINTRICLVSKYDTDTGNFGVRVKSISDQNKQAENLLLLFFTSQNTFRAQVSLKFPKIILTSRSFNRATALPTSSAKL